MRYYGEEESVCLLHYLHDPISVMRIAIYNRWLHTLGGGERETGAFAEVLRPQHHVDLVAHRPVDLRHFAERLHFDLAGVGLRICPDDPEHQSVAAISAEYDLFLNMSHGDLFVPRARHNLLRVFFPEPIDYPQTSPLLCGLYPPEADDAGRPFAWTGAYAELLLPPPNRSDQVLPPAAVELLLHGWRPPGAPPARVRLRLDGEHLAECELPPSGAWTTWKVPLPPLSTDSLRLTLETSTFSPQQYGGDDRRVLGIALAMARLLPRRWTPFARPTPVIPDTAAYAAMRARQAAASVGAYDQLLANAHYTQQWISRRWKLPSRVLYPPVDTASFRPATKRPIILNVGRFFPGSHNKKHLAMIEAFRALCDWGLHGWELHLAGSCDESMPKHRAYLAEVQAAATGYPIVLHTNAPFTEVQALYGAARIYWHATGYGEDEEAAPERLEHFGITTVEAMAAGCVPVVIARAGQLEIVEPEQNGLLWHTLPELQQQTRALVDDPMRWARLSEGARERSQAYGRDRFNRELHILLAELF